MSTVWKEALWSHTGLTSLETGTGRWQATVCLHESHPSCQSPAQLWGSLPLHRQLPARLYSGTKPKTVKERAKEPLQEWEVPKEEKTSYQPAGFACSL